MAFTCGLVSVVLLKSLHESHLGTWFLCSGQNPLSLNVCRHWNKDLASILLCQDWEHKG